VARRVYGDYLKWLLDTAAAEAGERFRLVRDEVIDIEGGCIRFRSGEAVEAERVILALGNLAPDVPTFIAPELFRSGVALADPWAPHIAEGLSDEGDVLLIGTGLTAVDVALTLDGSGYRGRILALSRRGLMPRSHLPSPAPAAAAAQPPSERGSLLLQRVRDAARQTDWRAAVDGLRPVTGALWAGESPAERRRFLRHLRPWWDVHRHRIAPAVAERIECMQAERRLAPAAGKIVSIVPEGSGALVRWRPRGLDATEALRVRRIILCTGPQMDIARAGDPLLDRLLASGRIRPDPCRIGIDVDEACRTLDANGRASETLLAVGPMTRGAFWEIVAVPDIRAQVKTLSELIAP
jgi:uncharacterized NAD(P)/FAD-binding protein YdhS